MHSIVKTVTDKIIQRSRDTRQAYLQQMQQTMQQNPPRKRLSCGNMAHAFAACDPSEKTTIAEAKQANFGIVTAYNDMLSAHQPFKDYPDQIKQYASSLSCTAQIAGGVPAMCDGVTQGQVGMEMSLFSRDVVAMSTAIALSHNMFDGNLFLGVCDKIVPGMLIGALQFGHLPAVFVPAGPMASGISNTEKAKKREQFAEGKLDTAGMLAVESASYHSPGTCTFYGTANSNQMLMEMLGVQLAGASFEAPNSELRPLLTQAAVSYLSESVQGKDYRPLYEVVTEKSIVNALVGLLATGGSTNHSLHLVAIAKAAGIELMWEDMDQLSKVVPLLARVYPNGTADINHFHAAGGMAYLVSELDRGSLLHQDVLNIMGMGLSDYKKKPSMNSDQSALVWEQSCDQSQDKSVLATVDNPFADNGGLRMLSGNMGKAVIKVSAVAQEHRIIEAPARVFSSQNQLKESFEKGDLNGDFIAVVRFQGPSANGMPELHKMTPLLAILQGRGQKVALVTDGRMSGASGKIPAAIHLSPEAAKGGLIGKVQEGDLMRLNAETGSLELLVSSSNIDARDQAKAPVVPQDLGRGLFTTSREAVTVAETGALSVFGKTP